MGLSCRIALVGDFDVAVVAHRAIVAALDLGGAEGVWIRTSAITDASAQLKDFDGIWCVPASPYENTDGALAAIRFARENLVPFLGTCGGFQHALLEYARNVCGMPGAAHGETSPDAEVRLIAPLACSLVEQTGEIVLAEGGRIRAAYGRERVIEGYHCSYGLNREFESVLFDGDLQATAHDLAGEVRGVELRAHPFFAGTLFQPERRALRGELPPLVAALIQAARRDGDLRFAR